MHPSGLKKTELSRNLLFFKNVSLIFFVIFNLMNYQKNTHTQSKRLTKEANQEKRE